MRGLSPYRRGRQIQRVQDRLEGGGLAQQRKVRLVRQQAQQDQVCILCPGAPQTTAARNIV